MWHAARHRAKTKGLPFDIEVNDIIIPSSCPVFGTMFIKNNHQLAPSLDRIDPVKGYVKGNVAVISNRANMLKGNASADDIKKLHDYLVRDCREIV